MFSDSWVGRGALVVERSFVSCCGGFRFGNGEVGNGRGKAPGEAREAGSGGVSQDDAMVLGAGGVSQDDAMALGAGGVSE